MKNLIKILTLSILLYFVPIVSMEQEADSMKEPYSEETQLDLVGSLPNELWPIVFFQIYFDPNILAEDCKNIHEGLECVKVRLPLITKNIRLVCKLWDCVDSLIDKNLLKEGLRKFYRCLLTEKYLELRTDGFYPKDDTWNFKKYLDKDIALFFYTGKEIYNGHLLVKIIDNSSCLDMNLKYKIISLLLFYGLDINTKIDADRLSMDSSEALNNYMKLKKAIWYIDNSSIGLHSYKKDDKGYTVLHFIVFWHSEHNNLQEIFRILLALGANVNIQEDYEGDTPLHSAIHEHSDTGDIIDYIFAGNKMELIKMLLTYGADIDIPNNAGKTAEDLAKAKGIDLEAMRKGNFSSNNSEKSTFCSLM